MNFQEAYVLTIGDHVEKKGKFAYLSWAYAVRFLRENYPQATWKVHENDHGLPIFSLGESHFVKISVLLDGQEFTQWHPILDNNNKPIKDPSTFHINTSIQRGLTKAIGIATGIGLGLYAGEDLPTDCDDKQHDQKQAPQGSLQLTSSQDAYGKLIEWIDKASENREKIPDQDAFKAWFMNDENKALVDAKSCLDAESLSAINRHFEQTKALVPSAQKKAA